MVNERLEKLINEDIYMGQTPDIAYHRYSGKQLVFLWGTEREQSRWYNRFGVRSGDTNSPIQVKHYRGITCEKFTPFRSFKDFYLPRNAKWYKGHGEEFEESFGRVGPLQVQGLVAQVDHIGIQILDSYFQNTFKHFRVRLPVMMGNVKHYPYTYFSFEHRFRKYDFHDRTLHLIRGVEPEPIPCRAVFQNGAQVSYYSVNP